MDAIGVAGGIAGLAGIVTVVTAGLFMAVLKSRLPSNVLIVLIIAGLVFAVAGFGTALAEKWLDNNGNQATPPFGPEQTSVAEPTLAVATACSVSGTVVGSDNKPFVEVAVGFTSSPAWLYLAATSTKGTFSGSCDLFKTKFPIELQVTTPKDSCVRASGVRIDAPGTYTNLNLKVQSVCINTIKIDPKILSTLVNGTEIRAK